ncbi:ubiquitin thioesterase OTU1 [Nematocida homosporus]|uniref:ubiquitin thioesterase OTU1 n=1 Tax=Nematocida homosporus TaxID=1912981 RepID=UPI00221F0B2B|nr:ubiquitin thioesterase OTU1 [Nematocida homosporus]KAI5185798.1 ubiquitin thioesterase OTU1 [Nematocida homosporus]
MRVKAVYGRTSFVCEFPDESSVAELYELVRARIGKAVFLFTTMPLQMIDEVEKRRVSELIADCDCIYLMDTPEARGPSEQKEADECAAVFSILEVPSDNSCLFHALSELLDARSSSELRKMVANTILENPKKFAIYLEKDPFAYSKWIVQPDTWGGATEIEIIARIYETKVCVIDRQLQCIEFGCEYRSVVYLQYSGVHYNAVIGKDQGRVIKKFPKGDVQALARAKEAVRESFASSSA